MENIYRNLYSSYTGSFEHLNMPPNLPLSLYDATQPGNKLIRPVISVRQNLYSHLDVIQKIREYVRSVNTYLVDEIISSHPEELIGKLNDPSQLDSLLESLKDVSDHSEFIRVVSPLDSDGELTDYLQTRISKLDFQILDGYGKMQGCIFEVPSDLLGKDYKQREYVTVTFPPTQPENLPSYLEQARYPSIETVLSIFGMNIYSVTQKKIDSIDTVVGLWYSLHDLDEGIHIPIFPTKIQDNPWLSNYPKGSYNHMWSEYVPGKKIINNTDRVRKLKRIYIVLLETIRWVYSLHLNQYIIKTNKLAWAIPTEDLIEQHRIFVDQYMTYGMDDPPLVHRVHRGTIGSIDSIRWYDLSNVKRKLPLIDSVPISIEYLRAMIPGLVNDQGRIWLYSEKLYRSLVYYLRIFTQQIDGVFNDEVIPTQLDGLYVYPVDFLIHPRNLVFRGIHKYQEWISHRNQTEIKINEELSDDHRRKIPYLYSDSEGRLFMIQNVSKHTLEQSLEVARQWYFNRRNLGYEINPRGPPYSHYVVYGISIGKQYYTIENNAVDDKPYLMIIKYGNNLYGAMLPFV